MTIMADKWTVNRLSGFFFKLNVLLTGVYFGIDVVMWLYNRMKRSDVNKVLFLRPIHCDVCQHRKNNDCNNRYCYNYISRTMTSYINGARHSLYICMNVFTSTDLSEVVLRAHERGVAVKVIGNYSTAHATGSQLSMLHRNG